MYKAEKEQIRSALDKWATRHPLEKNVYIFGVNDYARGIIRYLREKGIPVSAVIDNDRKKQGLYCSGVKIIPPGEGMDRERGEYILCSVFRREMGRQLRFEGIADRHILSIELDTFNESAFYNMRRVLRGRRLYRAIRRGHPHARIFLCPYTGTGDIYLIGTFLPAYLQREHIPEALYLVVNAACEKVFHIFGISNVVNLSSTEKCHDLVKFYMVCPDECEIEILNDSWGAVYTNNVQWIRGLHGMDFSEMFRKFVFHLPPGAKPVHPRFQDAGAEIQGIFEKHNLEPGRTVLLSPYANTLADMPDAFWEDIAKGLSEKGYCVCTNCGSDEESPVPGTERVFFPLSIAPQFVSAAGGFVGIRSGFCDVVSGASAKKVILYDRGNYFFNCTAFEYFSLKKMGLSDDAVEIEYEAMRTGLAKEKVLQEF